MWTALAITAGALSGAFVFLSLVLIFRICATQSTERQLSEARDLFQRRREWLEARFVTAASSTGKPRGLRWVNCDFENAVCFARDRKTGQLRALVAVTISFEAIEGGGMEDVEAVGNLRAATAVFQFQDGDWATHGRTLFNLNPEQAIEHFQHELETVD